MHGDCLTITGKTIAENLAALPALSKGQDVVHPVSESNQDDRPHPHHARQLLPRRRRRQDHRQGRPASSPAPPTASIPKKTCWPRCSRRKINKGDVVIIRYEGPQGGPGMPEMLSPTGSIVGAGLAKDVALITDGRFSGGSAGFIVGHVTPEAQLGGPIALVKNGDRITIDAEANMITIDLSADELSRRRKVMDSPTLQSHPRHALQVHQEREKCLRRLRDG